MGPVKYSRYGFGGVIGARLRANECNWLIKAPAANPGLLDMFVLRDEGLQRDIVPWAGEFIGKYLLSSIQALRFSNSPELRAQTANLIAKTIACQADDGYLGPFPKNVRLKAHWDLWGHYHVLQALLLWHGETGDADSLEAAIGIGDLICNTFLNTGIRIKDAGSEEMNMAVIHGLGLLYDETRNPRYLAMMRQIEIDWETSGDYLRTGVEAVPFYATPRPRWESLHDVQGLAALYRITGDARYLQALESHWRSILRWDIHNTGAFSTGEGAIGDQFSPGVVETCCTVAWMALCVDYLEISADPRAADALEIALYNAIAGAQHPNGEWFTYDTPMDGVRIPSYSAIAFQARPDTPGLNCCSVNGPRGLTMLSDWAVMQSGKGLAVNYYGPGTFEGRLSDLAESVKVRLEWKTNYPLDGHVELVVTPETPARFPLLLRIPAWSKKTAVRVIAESDTDAPQPKPGSYLTIDREWRAGDRIEIDLDMKIQVIPGDRATLGKVSLFRGPVLLAYDAANNSGPADPSSPLTMKAIGAAQITIESPGPLQPSNSWITATISTGVSSNVYLTDFASAGRTGSPYRTWLPASGTPLPAPMLRAPDDGAMVSRDKIVLMWSAPPPGVHELAYHVIVSEHPDLSSPIINRRCLNGTSYSITGPERNKIKPGKYYFWNVRIDARRPGARDFTFPARFKFAP